MKQELAAQLKRFEEMLISEEKSAATVEKYLHDVTAFFNYLDTETLSKQTMIVYKQHLLQSGYSVRSINAAVAALNAFLIFLGRTDCKLRSVRIQRQMYRTAEKELTKAEYRRLIDAAKEDVRLMMQTICATGIRVSELQYITVEAVKAGEAVVSLKGKTRRIFLVKELRKKLLAYIKARRICAGSVFVTKTGNPVDRITVWREMKKLCRKANVPPEKVFPHNLRHLFARVFYEKEKDIAKLADILGHSSIETTRIYIISSGKEHQMRMERMHLII